MQYGHLTEQEAAELAQHYIDSGPPPYKAAIQAAAAKANTILDRLGVDPGYRQKRRETTFTDADAQEAADARVLGAELARQMRRSDLGFDYDGEDR